MGNNLQKLPEDETDGAKKKRNKIIHAQDKFVETLMNNLEPESSEEANWTDEGPDEEGLDEVDGPIVQVDLTRYDFPFENLVFEGGGNKGLAYCGAVRVLETIEEPDLPPEERKLPKKIKRFAGTSAGAMTAALLAVGYNSYDIQSFLSQDLSEIFLDHGWGYLSLLPNLIMGYGWNPGKRIFDWFGNALAARPDGHADITFAQVYEKYGKELCVVVTNLNMMTTEYFHPKTTPDTPVRVAVRMSMGIPGLFQATPFANRRHAKTGHQSIYVDGGVLCNYPIHCFDGSKKKQAKEIRDRAKHKHNRNLKAINEFLKVLREPSDNTNENPQIEHASNGLQNGLQNVTERSGQEAVNDKINISDLQKALEKINEEDFRHLFGEGVTIEEATNALDQSGDGQLSFAELLNFIERNGVSLQECFLSYQRKEIKGLYSFFDTLQSALLTNLRRLVVEDRDIERTVGINTGHVGTSDFTLEEKDREYVVEQGERATENFLRKYVENHDTPLKSH